MVEYPAWFFAGERGTCSHAVSSGLTEDRLTESNEVKKIRWKGGEQIANTERERGEQIASAGWDSGEQIASTER